MVQEWCGWDVLHVQGHQEKEESQSWRYLWGPSLEFQMKALDVFLRAKRSP